MLLKISSDLVALAMFILVIGLLSYALTHTKTKNLVQHLDKHNVNFEYLAIKKMNEKRKK